MHLSISLSTPLMKGHIKFSQKTHFLLPSILCSSATAPCLLRFPASLLGCVSLLVHPSLRNRCSGLSNSEINAIYYRIIRRTLYAVVRAQDNLVRALSIFRVTATTATTMSLEHLHVFHQSLCSRAACVEHPGIDSTSAAADIHSGGVRSSPGNLYIWHCTLAGRLSHGR